MNTSFMLVIINLVCVCICACMRVCVSHESKQDVAINIIAIYRIMMVLF